MGASPARRSVLVTGASAGIGAAFAEAYAARGRDLVLVARREERLHEIAGRLHERHGVTASVLVADLADAEAPARIAQTLDAQAIEIDVLVNNAGFGVPEVFVAKPFRIHADTLQVMVTATAELCHLLIPGMRARGAGVIINVASLAGLLPAPAGHTLYGAVKAWMIRFSESLAFELREDGIKVCAVCPGFTRTEFHDVAGTRELVSRLPRFMWMSAAEVAEQGIAAAERGEIVYINGRLNRAIALLARWLPQALVYRIMRWRARDFRKL
jgi:short-subunit dehydrogenase